MVTARGRLRLQVFDMSGGWCEYPQCEERASSLAHAHSIGMGGRKSADTLDNVLAACPSHGLLTDGAIPGDRGRDWYLQQLGLLGVDVWDWNAAEALKAHIARNRPKTVPS